MIVVDSFHNECDLISTVDSVQWIIKLLTKTALETKTIKDLSIDNFSHVFPNLFAKLLRQVLHS